MDNNTDTEFTRPSKRVSSSNSDETRPVRPAGDRRVRRPAQSCRSTIIFLISAMAFAGFRPFGQVLAQFMMVWQR